MQIFAHVVKLGPSDLTPLDSTDVTMTKEIPVWDTDISPLFAMPYWVNETQRATVGYTWTRCMSSYLIDFTSYDSVREWSVTIYNHLASRNMPLTTDASQFWPPEALECFRQWVNAGWPQTKGAPMDQQTRIPAPAAPTTGLRVRKDITTLTEAELNRFRAALQDTMQVFNDQPDSPWQQWAYIHTNWCLHYQEAFGFWHRAFLMYLEDLIGMAIPYWDWMAAAQADPDSPVAGLPQAYRDLTYIHPDTGKEEKNPLRFAAAKDGCSKLCVLDPSLKGQDICRHVNRLPVFDVDSQPEFPGRDAWFKLPRLFQQQVVDALKFETFSTPQGAWGQPGVPWSNIPVFTPPQPDDLYPFRELNFDGLYEQPHDNFHGWIGYDMADNAYTAFDPIFIAYHANIDRMLEVWVRAHPGAQYTTQTPIQPFVGPLAKEVDFATDEIWRYTTMGQLAQDSRRLGYDYGPPAGAQFTGDDVQNAGSATPQAPSGDQATQAGEAQVAGGPWVAFDGVRCTQDSYAIDVFLNKPDADLGDVDPQCPEYVGRFTRIGMGIEDDKGRCIKHGVTRVLNARHVAARVGIATGEMPQVTTLVTRLVDGSRLSEAEVAQLPGFEAQFIWGDPRNTQILNGANDAVCGC